ncbi:MAG: hypothetical protein ABIK82_17105 [Pseudomonadota bacterium]
MRQEHDNAQQAVNGILLERGIIPRSSHGRSQDQMLNSQSSTEQWLDGWSTTAPTTYQGSETLAFQRWFKFKEAFSPSLVRSIIESLPTRPTSILDCCAGSGTTGVVAQFMGIRPWLMEVNPFLADLTESKLANYSDFDIPREAAKVVKRFHDTSVSIGDIRDRLPPTFVEPGVNDRWIFDKLIVKRIERLRHAIEASKSPSIRRLFRVALGGMLIGLSNVRVDGKGRRYRQNWQARHLDPDEVLPRFIDGVKHMVEDIYRYSTLSRPNTSVLRGDARQLLPLFDESIDAAIFSPPYPNSFDYTDIYNVELWMLGYFGRSEDNAQLRLSTMRSHVQVAWEMPTSCTSGLLKKTLQQLHARREELWDHRLPEMVHGYFEDLTGMLREIRRCLTPGGHVAIVVGDSSYAGVRIDSAKILAEAVGPLGFQIQSQESVRVMRASMQQRRGEKVLDEWLIRLRRSD